MAGRKGNSQSIHIDDLAKMVLSKEIIESLGDEKITIKQAIDWFNSQPEGLIAIEEGKIRVSIRKNFSLKKTLAALTGALAAFGSAMWYLTNAGVLL